MSVEAYFPKGMLKEFVDTINFISGDMMATGVAFPRTHQVIIINLGSNFNSSDVYDPSKEGFEVNDTVWINGKHESPFMLGNKVNNMAMYAIAVKLGMLPFFADMPASETNEQAVGAQNWTSREIFFLREQLLACNDIYSGFLLIEKYLLNIVRHRDLTPLKKIQWLGKAIYNSPVNEICDTLGYTRKRLSKEATHFFGSPVKTVQGIIRFNQTLTAIANNSDDSLSSLHEYYDQSHFINDFKARTGITPLQYKRLCRQFPVIKYTPNFIPLKKETFLQFISA